jgi:lipopolysaccharide/colanic/teichoic acid biosynthesis glycosyltransferase
MDPIPLPKAKRFFDVLASIVVILLLSPLLLALFILFILEEIFSPSARGPLFYTETRISQGKLFQLSKIRVFKTEALKKAGSTPGIIHTKKLEQSKNNLTLTGRLLRQIYMDEVPQLYAVLKGDMSLIGPRPTNPENYEKDLMNGLSAKRILVAGLTGSFQTHKHKKYNYNQEKVDMEYATFCKESSGLRIIFHDLYILLQTAVTIIRAEGL